MDLENGTLHIEVATIATSHQVLEHWLLNLSTASELSISGYAFDKGM
jgi:hypothetical protein